MKLTINNKLVVISKKKIVLLFIIKFIWVIIEHFIFIYIYILCFSYIIIYYYYYYYLFIYLIKIGNWQSTIGNRQVTCYLVLFLYIKIHEIR